MEIALAEHNNSAVCQKMNKIKLHISQLGTWRQTLTS